jgi:uncharacterized UPF0160 family protein
MSKYTVVTHSRSFHIDELMAITLLDKFLLKGDYDLIRTRDETILKTHQASDTSFVIDVGFLYAEDKLNFDHHQKTFDLQWSNGVPYSSCGIVWSFLKKNKMLNKQLSDFEINHIEKNVIMKIDAHDNGIESFKDTLFALKFNRNSQIDSMIDKQFNKAMIVLSDYFDNVLFELRNGKSNTNYIEFLISIVLLNTFKMKDKKINSLKEFFDYAKNIKINRSWGVNEEFGILGQVWYDLWQDKDVLLSSKIKEDLKKELESKFIKPIDQGKFDELSYLNKYQRTNGNLDKNAIQASTYAFFNYLSSIKAKIEDFKLLKKDVEDSKNLKGFVVLKSKYADSTTNMLRLCDKDLFISPHSKGKWIIQTVPLNKTDLFSQKCPMPKKWRGLSGDDLFKASGFNGLDFCHKNGFMCVFIGDLNEVKNIANVILKENNYDFNKKNKVFNIPVKSSENEKLLDHNEILDIKSCIDNSKEFENVVILDKNYSDESLKELIKTNKKFFIKKKGDIRWIIGTIDKSKFIDSSWKKLHGDKLFEVSQIEELCSCDKKLNSIVAKCSKSRAIEIAKELNL